MQKDKILVFIPMYNCERQISRVLAQFTPDINNYFTEILVVDNISQDNSVTVAKEKMTDIKGVKQTLIQNKKNYSLGGSHKVAFNYAISLIMLLFYMVMTRGLLKILSLA
jgi:glycosyltransferase involved in cell wall biosynthesis